MFDHHQEAAIPALGKYDEVTCEQIAEDILQRAKKEARGNQPGSKLTVIQSYHPYDHSEMAMRLTIVALGDKDVQYYSTQENYHTFVIR